MSEVVAGGAEDRDREADLLISFLPVFSPPPVPKDIAQRSLHPGLWGSLCEKQKLPADTPLLSL